MLSNLPDNTKVVIIKVHSARGIEGVNTFSKSSEPYAEIKLRPPDPVAGEQVKCTSKRPPTLEPRWEPAEKFQFIVTNPSTSKIVISLYHFNGTSNPVGLGDTAIAVKDITDVSTTKSLKLKNPDTGKMRGDIEIEVCTKLAIDASNEEEHLVYEYQRWQAVIGWGHSLLPGDPGRWSSANGTRFEKEFDNIVPDIPTGWVVMKAWSTVSTTTDPEGWQYSDSFMSVDWHPNEIKGCKFYIYILHYKWITLYISYHVL